MNEQWNKHVIFEVMMLNSQDLRTLKDLESNGIIKRLRVNDDGTLDKRTIKKGAL